MVKGFNRDMDRYLRTRKDSKFSLRFGKKEKKVVIPENVEVEDRQSFWSSLFKKKDPVIDEDLTPAERLKLEAMERDIQKVDEAEEYDPAHHDMYEERKASMWERFFQNMRLFKQRHRVEEEAEAIYAVEDELVEEKAKVDEDVKEVIKITHKWLGRLSKRQKDEFMDSSDYEQYKAILVKYGLAKK